MPHRLSALPSVRRTLLAAALAVGLALPAGAAHAASDPAFQTWLDGVKRDARAQGVSDATLEAAFDGVEPIARVIELDRSQPESTMTFAQYRERIVSDARISKGRAMLAEHRALLDEIGPKYGVQPRFIVALWGIETNFGANTGGFPVIASLATLAYDGRRSDYFRKELMNALQILEEGHIEPARMMGSWAGAMGQSQFMPSSFLNYAQDHDGNGHKDIWGTKADVFASAANYLSSVGWRDDITWGREVTLPSSFEPLLADPRVVKKISDWERLGVRKADGSDLPGRDLDASIVLPDGPDGPAFMIYDNYRAILRWNRSHYFATSVGLLSDRIAGR